MKVDRLKMLRLGLFFFGVIAYSQLIVDPIFSFLSIDNKTEKFDTLSLNEIIISLALVPMLEEIGFRTHLSMKKKHFFGVFIMLLFFCVSYNDLGIIFIVTVLALILVLTFYFDKASFILLKKYPLFTFYVTSILFCVFHYSYVAAYDFFVVYKIGLLLLSYLPLSLLLGYVRKEMGLLASIIMHSIYNIIILLSNSLF